MYLTRRSVWAVLAGTVAVIVLPRPATALVWVAAWAVLAVVDVVAAPSPRSLRVERRVPRSVRLGETTSATLTVSNLGRRVAHLEVRDAWQPSAGASAERSSVDLGPGERRRLRVRLSPTRRGDRQADLVTIRSAGPLGLAGRQASLRSPAQVRVLPEFVSRKYLPSRLARLRELDGRSAVMVRGAGTEFDSLREYVVGDDVRSIDWRSTARRGEVVVRTWRPERDRRVLVLVDTARLAAARLGDAPRLDAQIEATLLLAALASRAGDRVDVVALDDAVRAQVRGQSGPALMNALADRLAPVEARLVEPSWTLMAKVVGETLSQRALVVVLTALDPASVDTEMLRTMGALAHEHTVVMASATDPELEVVRSTRLTADDVYLAAAAERAVVEADAVQARLRRRGVEVVEATPAALAPALADTYLALKAAGRL